MAIRFSNNAQTTLASGITAAATSISVVDGSVFPALTPGDHTYVTLEDTSGNLEIVKVTAISSNTLTVTRGQDGTTAQAFSSGDFVQLRVTAALLNDLADEASVTLWADVQNKPDPVITLAGDATGSATLSDLASATLTVTIADDSHNHVISNVDGLQTALDGKTAPPTSNDNFSGTYSLVWVASDVLYSSTFMTINGATETLSVPNLSTGVITATGTSAINNFRLTDSSKMGFGTVKAGTTVGHNASVDEGIFWHTDNEYGIYRTAGAWSNPDYPYLKVSFRTGIKLDGGTAGQYTYSGVDIVGGSDLQMAGNTVIDASRNITAGTISSGAITSTGTSTFPGIRVNNANTALSQGGGNSLRIQTNSGYVEVGPRNTVYAHFVTDRDQFYFDHPVYFNGQIYNYVSGGTSDPYWRAGNDGSGSGLDADLLDGNQSSFFADKTNSQSFSAEQIFTGIARVATGSIATTNTTKGLVFDGNYTNGQYRHRWRKQDNGGNVPLYLDYSAGTANSYTALARFGAYTGNGYEFEVYGDINATGSVYDSGNPVWHSGNDGSGSGLDADLLDGNHASAFLTSTNDRVYITDSRGAQRAPSYYDDRYVQWDFQNIADTGAGGDGWHVLQTVSPWSSYNDAHRQQQLVFTGSGGLKFRYASSDSAWTGWQTLWTSGNDGSGSGLDADTVDGVQASSFLRSDESDVFVGDYLRFNDSKVLRFGNGSDFRIWHDGASGTYLRNYAPAGSTYFQNEDNAGANHAMLYLRGDTDAPYVQLYGDGSETFRTKAGGVKVTGEAEAPHIFIDRNNNTASGINWYSASYKAWSMYMAPTGAGMGPNGNITAPSGTIVTSWAQRSFIENASGYGWTFESGTSTSDPTVVAEIRSSDGAGSFGPLQGSTLAVNNTSSSSKNGLSLYGGINESINPTYGIMFTGTSGSGTHGSVSGDWATYFTMNGSAGRGWIFRNQSSPANVASISNVGYLTATRLYAGDGNDGYFFSDANGRTAFTGGDFYIQSGVSNSYNYATNQYIGNASGNNIYFRGNTLSGNGWEMSGGGNLATGGVIRRNAHNAGHLEGGHNNLGSTASRTSPIYTIGSSYNPNEGSLGNMYGVGFGHNGNGTFLTGVSALTQGTSGWGMYVAADGDARIFLNSESGEILSTGQHYAAGSVVWNAGNDGSGSGLDADLLDGFQLSSIPYATDGNSRGSVNTAASAAGSAANALTRSCFFRDNNTDFAALGINVQHSTSNNYNFQFGVGSYSDASALAARVKNNGTWGSSVTIWNSGNDGSGSGLDADLLDGYNSNSYLNKNGTSHYQANTWIQFNGGTNYGLYFPSSGSGTHLYPNGSSYSSFTIEGSKGGYWGFSAPTSAGRVNAMWKNNVSGFYNETHGWHFHWNSGTLYVGKDTNGGTDATVWDSANDGSGSGLDADLLDGLGSSSFVKTTDDLRDHGYMHLSSGSSSTNPNNTAEAWFLTNNSNGPSSSYYWHVQTWFWASKSTSANRAQLAIQYNGGNDVYVRSLYNTWNSWAKLWSTANDGSGSGLDADTCDGQHLGTTANVTHNQIYADSWFRSNGATGWYNQSYAGGIYMTDTTWVRTYNNKSFYVGGGNIATSGNVTAYYSDERLKERTGRIDDALEKVLSLEGFTYVENDLARELGYTNSKEQVGLSAQRVQAVLPQAVSLAPVDYETTEDGEIVSKSGENYLTVDYSRLVPLLVESIRELKAEVDDLKAQLKEK